MVEMKRYTVTATRSGSWWAFSIPEILGAHGQAKRLDQVKDEAREVVAMMLDAPEDSFDLELEVTLDPRMEHVLEEAQSARDSVESGQRIAQEKLLAAAEQLSSIGLSLRDIGSLLNVSFQRVAQILNAQRKVL
jgi:predicted RNase H-like HicB family nuclease